MANTEPGQQFASWLWGAMRAAGYPPEPDRRLAGRTRFAAAAGVSVSTVTRALDMARVPEPAVLRKMAPALRRAVTEAFVAAGYLTPAEIGTTEGTPPSVLITDVATAIRHDADLLEEARDHLLNQYQLLLRLSEREPSDAASSPAAPPDDDELQQRHRDLLDDTRRNAARDEARQVVHPPSTGTIEEELRDDATPTASGEDQ